VVGKLVDLLDELLGGRGKASGVGDVDGGLYVLKKEGQIFFFPPFFFVPYFLLFSFPLFSPFLLPPP
jgi:hypothetical protein